MLKKFLIVSFVFKHVLGQLLLSHEDVVAIFFLCDGCRSYSQVHEPVWNWSCCVVLCRIYYSLEGVRVYSVHFAWCIRSKYSGFIWFYIHIFGHGLNFFLCLSYVGLVTKQWYCELYRLAYAWYFQCFHPATDGVTSCNVIIYVLRDSCRPCLYSNNPKVSMFQNEATRFIQMHVNDY